MIKTRTWVIIFCVFLAVCAVLSIFIFTRKADGAIANIYQNGECIYSIDLSAVTEEYEFTVPCNSGSNTIRIKPGAICISDADCPDRICVNTGWTTDSAFPIVCLPHKLVIKIEKSAGANADNIDAVAQ